MNLTVIRVEVIEFKPSVNIVAYKRLNMAIINAANHTINILEQ